MDTVDYLVLGSGWSSLAFSSLMAKSGKSVKIIEAHEHFGGYGHNFTEGDFQFNAQLHYVIGCGEGQVVHQFLKALELDQQVQFHRLNPEGYDRVYCGNQTLWIPYGYDRLAENLLKVCPEAKKAIQHFIGILKAFEQVALNFPETLSQSHRLFRTLPAFLKIAGLRNATLQEVFDQCQLPKILQTLVAGQLIDYMLPPSELSFLVWAALFNAYNQGAYYPVRHFGFVVDQVVNCLQHHGAQLLPNEQVVEFIRQGREIQGVRTQQVDPRTGIRSGPKKAHYGKTIICNFDPKLAAEMIGLEHFSRKVRRALAYDYSHSSFVLYGVVKDLDLAQFGFGDWNIWHCQPDHQEAFRAMYQDADYSKPYFAMNCRSLHTPDHSHCQRENCQIFQICTVANYDYWKDLKLRDHRAYYRKKNEVLDHLLETVEKQYVPNIREHLIFKMTGSPTTNERFVGAPKGGSYGVNLTPRNFSLSRKLTHYSSLPNFYFCSAASGVGGFGGAIYTGTKLYRYLSGDSRLIPSQN